MQFHIRRPLNLNISSNNDKSNFDKKISLDYLLMVILVLPTFVMLVISEIGNSAFILPIIYVLFFWKNKICIHCKHFMAIQELLVTLDGSYPNYHIFCVILLKYCCCYYIAVLKICKQQYIREVRRRWAFISVPQITHGRFSRGNHAILPNWIRYIHINFGISLNIHWNVSDMCIYVEKIHIAD